jgi:hypothetical protein
MFRPLRTGNNAGNGETAMLLLKSVAPLLLLAVLSGPALAADKYITNLGPMPLDDASKVNIQGRGDASATLDGRNLTVSGSFHGLPSPATVAHINLSPAIGVPGVKIFDLTVTQADKGTVSGTLHLSASQAEAFRTGRLYVQIDSQKAPDGTVWGWLLPDHTIVGPDVPQEGHWFLPQYDTPSR